MNRVRSRTTGWTLIGATWCAAALLDASQTLLTMRAMGAGRAWLLPFSIVFVSWLPWTLATPFIFLLARQQPIVRGHLLKSLSAHLAAFAAISVVAESWSALLRVIFNPWHRTSAPAFMDTWSELLIGQLMTFVITYLLIVACDYVMESRDKMMRQATETARLNAELSQAQLAVLRGQMDPHFMFNTLNSIASLVYEQRSEAAVSMIVGLSEFLRRGLEDSHRAQVTLREEVEYLQRYIEIQQVRFSDRLLVSVDIPTALLTTPVPNLLLQPLVENAIKHGVSKRQSGGEIRVAGMCHDGALRLTIFNDGPWVQEDLAQAPHRVGLANLRTRLRLLHGDRSELVLRPAETGGVEVIVTLPLLEA